MRRAALPICAACAALVVAGCGGSSAGAHRRRAGGGQATHGAKGAAAHHHGPTEVSAAAVTRAAAHSAAQPGYAVALTVSVSSSLVDGTVGAGGTGVFGPASGAAQLRLSLPGLFSVISPISTQVIFVGDQAYAKVPASISDQATGVRPWIAESLDSFGRSLGLPSAILSGALTPRTLLAAFAAEPAGQKATSLGRTTIGGSTVEGYREAATPLGDQTTVSVWIDPATDLVSRVSLSYAAAHGAGIRADAVVTFTGYGAQDVPPAPAPSQVGTLSEALKALGI